MVERWECMWGSGGMGWHWLPIFGVFVCLLGTLLGGGLVMAFPVPPPPGRLRLPGHFLIHYFGAMVTFICMLLPLVVSEGWRAWPAYVAGFGFVLAFFWRYVATRLGWTQ